VFIFVGSSLYLSRAPASSVQGLHPLHRVRRFVLQGPEQRFDDQSENDDCESVTLEPGVEAIHRVEQRFAHDPEDAEVHDLGLTIRRVPVGAVFSWANIQRELLLDLLPGRDGEAGHAQGTIHRVSWSAALALRVTGTLPSLVGHGESPRPNAGAPLPRLDISGCCFRATTAVTSEVKYCSLRPPTESRRTSRYSRPLRLREHEEAPALNQFTSMNLFPLRASN
jgi:hypothetical protein